MDQADPRTQPSKPQPKGRLIAGWILTGLMTAFLLLDCALHFAQPQPVADAFAHLGIPMRVSTVIAVILLASTLLYVVPKSSVLGAILITGYLGGAIAIHLRAGSSTFETVFPAILGIVTWAGIYLRDSRVAALIPLRS